MTPFSRNQSTRNHPWRSRASVSMAVVAVALGLAIPPLHAQSSGTPPQSQPPASSQPPQDIPDAPSTVQPPVPKPAFPPPDATSTPAPQQEEGSSSSSSSQTDSGQKPAPPPIPPIETVTPGQSPRNQINPKQDLFTISVTANFVQIPVMVKDADGRRVDGLLPKDFTVYENDKKQDLSYFTSDPYLLSVAIVLDTGMADVSLQKVNQTYSALVGAFSPYDEVALYTYSSTVSQVRGFEGRPEKLTSALNQMKLVRGRDSGPPVMGGPFSGGPTVNGAPVGGPTIQPVNTPDREYHVLNDAILEAATDLSKRDRTRRKIIFVISDGRDLGSKTSYKDVLKVLQTRDIQVKAVTVDTGALPVFRQIEKIHIPLQGRNNILPKYVAATGGGLDDPALTVSGIEEAYGRITNEARNQYALGYSPKATAGGSPYRSIEVVVDKKGLKVSAKAGYYPR